MKQRKIIFLFFVSILIFFYLLNNLDQFMLKSIKFTHPVYVKKEVEDTVKLYVNKISLLNPLLHKQIERQLLKQYTMIDNVQIKRRWPSTIECNVNIKPPWFMIIINGKSIWCSKDGTILGDYEYIEDQTNFVIVSGLDHAYLDKTRLDTNLFTSLSTLINRLYLDYPGNQFQVFLDKDLVNIVLSKDSHLKILLGGFGSIDLKMHLLKKYFKHDHARQLAENTYLDLSMKGELLMGKSSEN